MSDLFISPLFLSSFLFLNGFIKRRGFLAFSPKITYYIIARVRGGVGQGSKGSMVVINAMSSIQVGP